jgi:hypothetical protein
MRAILFIIPLFFLACSGNDSLKNPEPSRTDEKIVVTFKGEVDMMNRKVAIDALVEQAGNVATSLNYMKSDGAFVKVLAYLSKENVILKIEEQFADGADRTNGKVIYYMNDGKPFLTQELIDEVSGTAHRFVDRISFYNKSGKVVKTKERSAPYQEETEQLAYSAARFHAVAIDRAMRALNAKGEFETTFQGFVNEGPILYLVVGENNEDGYTSALKCDFQDQLLKQLSKNSQQQLGKKLQVSFVVEEDQGSVYQIYTGGQLAK